ncbi:MAG: hypothetical protein H6Q69_64 [Firmicutes bacterium]|nr:hypothetical protein [Bacillota bacterium]
MEIELVDWLQAVQHELELRQWRSESGGRTKHIVITQEFEDFAPQIIKWYMLNRDNESYRMWHPAHKYFQWEDKRVGVGATWIGWEKINGSMGAYRMRLVPGEMSPIQPTSKISMVSAVIDVNDEPLFYILNEMVILDKKTQVKITFAFPESTPKEYIDAHTKHALEEFPNMIHKAIPWFIQKTFGYLPTQEELLELISQ